MRKDEMVYMKSRGTQHEIVRQEISIDTTLKIHSRYTETHQNIARPQPTTALRRPANDIRILDLHQTSLHNGYQVSCQDHPGGGERTITPMSLDHLAVNLANRRF